MEHQDEHHRRDETGSSLWSAGRRRQRAAGRCPVRMRPLLLPLPPTGSAVFAQAWTRQVVSSLLGRQLAQAWVAVAGAIDGENEFLHPRCA